MQEVGVKRDRANEEFSAYALNIRKKMPATVDAMLPVPGLHLAELCLIR